MPDLPALLAVDLSPPGFDVGALANLGGCVAICATFIYYLIVRDRGAHEKDQKHLDQVGAMVKNGHDHAAALTDKFAETVGEINRQLRAVADANVQITRESVSAVHQLKASVDALRDEIHHNHVPTGPPAKGGGR